MEHNPDDALSNREHWLRYVMSSVPPKNFADLVVARYKELTKRKVSRAKVYNVKAGRAYDRLIHTIIYEISQRAEGVEVLGRASNPPREAGGRSLAPVSR